MACLEPSLIRSRLQNLQVGSDAMSDVRDVVAVVFSLIMLRRVKGHAVEMHNGSVYIVGKDIPIPQVGTLKLNMDPEGLALFRSQDPWRGQAAPVHPRNPAAHLGMYPMQTTTTTARMNREVD